VSWFKKKGEPVTIEHGYSVEYLYHFLCGACAKWWTISDWNESGKVNLYCPHCGAFGKGVDSAD
jgi:hypothetical protein